MNTEARSRWRWAGIVVIDEAGNTVAWEVANPVGTVNVTREMSRGSLSDGTFFARPLGIETTIKLTLEGHAARVWEHGRHAAPDTGDLRNIGLIGHPDAGKTLLGNDIKGLTEKPYTIGEGQ